MNPTGKAVIFDLDGVLTDTIEPHYQSWRILTQEIGVPFNREINERLRGRSRPDSLDIILGDRTGEFPADRKAELLRRKNELFLDLIASMSAADLYPGVGALLAELQRRDVPLAVASSSRNSAFILERLGIRDRFRTVVDANEVPQSKPHPRVYLLAAERLGVPPERCIAIEDGASGVAAARAAGMTVIGVGPIENVGAAHRIFPEMRVLTADVVLGV